jgi:hypothetical protein
MVICLQISPHFNRWKNCFSQLLNNVVSDVRQMKIDTAQQVPGQSKSEVEIGIAKLNKFKLPGSDQIVAELIQAGDETLL